MLECSALPVLRKAERPKVARQSASKKSIMCVKLFDYDTAGDALTEAMGMLEKCEGKPSSEILSRLFYAQLYCKSLHEAITTFSNLCAMRVHMDASLVASGIMAMVLATDPQSHDYAGDSFLSEVMVLISDIVCRPDMDAVAPVEAAVVAFSSGFYSTFRENFDELSALYEQEMAPLVVDMRAYVDKLILRTQRLLTGSDTHVRMVPQASRISEIGNMYRSF